MATDEISVANTCPVYRELGGRPFKNPSEAPSRKRLNPRARKSQIVPFRNHQFVEMLIHIYVEYENQIPVILLN